MKTLTAKTHIATIRQQNETQIEQVCNLLAWSELQYCTHQFELYTRFLTRMYHGWPVHFLKDAMYSPVMRGYWNNQVSERNSEFLKWGIELNESQSELTPEGSILTIPGVPCGDAYYLEEYLFTHSVERLCNDKLFMDGYCQVIKMI